MALHHFSLIAERYASALFQLSADARDAVAEDLQTLAGWAEQSTEFKAFLHNPALSRQQQASVMDALLAKAKANPLTRRFIQRLCLNRRLEVLPQIAGAFDARVKETQGILTADVTAAVELSAKQAKEVAGALSEATGKTVQIRTHTDARLLGGLRVQIGDTQIDASLAGKLSRLAGVLKHAA